MSDRKRLSDKMRGRMERTSPVARHVGEGAASATGETAARDVKPVRITVDLTRAQHRALRMFALEHDTDGSKVVRACLDELLAGGAVADAITARLTTD
jgi:hypothetical protein